MRGLHPETVGSGPIRAHTSGLADLAAVDRLDRPVTTCGDWSLADLVWHLTEVQAFWSYIIDNRPAGPENYVEPSRRGDDQLFHGLNRAVDQLTDALDRANPQDQAWSWSDDHTVGFTMRRQTHEALVHHVDGLLACGRELDAVDPRLAADGVDELVTVILSGVPPDLTFERTAGVIELRATDTGDRWTLAFGRARRAGGQDSLDAVELTAGAEPDALVGARAIDLDLWLWGRAKPEVLETAGDDDLVARLRSLVTQTSQ